jgi:hypothetical protein
MSLYENASKHINTGSDKYVKLQPGQKARLRVLDHPYVSLKQFREGGDISTRFHWPVWDYAAKKAKILEQGPMVFNLIADVVAEYGETVPMECDIVLGRSGEGRNTRYSAVPGKVQEELPKDVDMPDLKTIQGGIPLDKFSKGEKPDVQPPKGMTEMSDDDFLEIFDK